MLINSSLSSLSSFFNPSLLLKRKCYALLNTIEVAVLLLEVAEESVLSVNLIKMHYDLGQPFHLHGFITFKATPRWVAFSKYKCIQVLVEARRVYLLYMFYHTLQPVAKRHRRITSFTIVNRGNSSHFFKSYVRVNVT